MERPQERDREREIDHVGLDIRRIAGDSSVRRTMPKTSSAHKEMKRNIAGVVAAHIKATDRVVHSRMNIHERPAGSRDES